MATTGTRSQFRTLLILAGVLATIATSFMFAQTQTADASPFCGGQVRSNYGTCYGAARTVYAGGGVSGYGDQHSVCLGISILGGGCSSGPGHVHVMWLSYTINGSPWIQVNAPGASTLWGNTF
jgi:hypothetical protein